MRDYHNGILGTEGGTPVTGHTFFVVRSDLILEFHTPKTAVHHASLAPPAPVVVDLDIELRGYLGYG
jgi:hypothetical protein